MASPLEFNLTDNELNAISKSYELFRIIMHKKIPIKEKLFTATKLLKDANVNFPNEYLEQNTPLHVAVARGYTEIVELLMKFNADVNAKNEDGETPLHVAVARGAVSIVELLVKGGADSTLVNDAGETALDAAKENQQVIRVLSNIHPTPSQECYKHRLEVNEGKTPNQDLGLPSASVDAFSTLPKAHSASGAKFSLHGTVYQLKLLMLFLVRALRQGYPFRLATEMDEAEKFDDLVFQYQIGQDIKSLYLQAKHKQNAAKGMISMADLLSVAKTDQFSLHKYFMSYYKIKQRIGLKADEIDYVICTNTNFDFKEPCKLTNDSSVFCFQEVDKFSQDYKEYFKEGKCYRLSIDDTTLKLLCEKFAVAEENLGTISEDYKNSIRIFFSRLIFAVGQPNELKLDEIIKTEFEFSDHINLLNTEFVANSLMKLMLDWFKAKEGTFFSNVDATNFMDAMKQKINHLKSAGINSEYPELLQTFGISFNDNTLHELHKVISEHKIIHLITPKETMLTGIKVVGMIKYSGNYRKDDSYVFVRLSTLLLRETQEIVIGAFKSSGSHDLLVIDCSSDNGTMLELFRRLLEILQDKDNTQKKIILIAQENHPLLQMFKTVPQYYNQKVVNKFQDFTPESQVILISTPVMYQGERFELRQIVDEAEIDLLEVIPLEDLIKKDPIVIGAKLPVSNGYNKAFYINRTLKNQIAVKLIDFLLEENSQPDTDVVYTEGEFDQLCKEYPDKNIHMLKKEEFGYTWIQTQGSLENLRRFIDSSYSQCFTEEQVLSVVESQRVVIISDSAGMGKSTVLTHISKLIKDKCPACFVFRIDLNNFTDDLEKARVVQFDNSSAINFICNRMIMIQTPLECALFKRRGKVVLLFDGFDEISPDYNNTVIDLIQNLREATEAQIWVATRPFMREELEDALQQFSYTLETFSEYNQFNFLTEFWKYTLHMNASENQIIIFAKSLIKRLAESISDKERALTGIPLQIRILAECFIEDMKDFLNSGLSEPVLDECFKLVDLYKRFISKKFEVYLTEKAGVLESNPTVKSFQKILLETHMKNHELLALLAVLSVEKVDLLEPIFKNPIDSDDTLTDLNKIGIVNIVDKKPRFLHYTFAEYLVAVYLMRVLIQERQREIQEFILTDILLGDKYIMVRAFINELLITSQPNIEQLNAYGNLMVVLCENNKNDKNNILHQAAEEDNYEILAFLCNCMKTHSRMLQELLLSTNSDGRNVPQVAAQHNRIVLIGNLLKWMQGTLCQGDQEMLTSFLLATNENGSTLHVAASCNQTAFTEAYFQWVQGNMSPDKGLALLDTLLQTTDKYFEYTLLHEAVRQGNTALIEALLVWTKVHLSHNRLKSMILATNTWKTTILHVLAHYGYVTVAETLLNWIRDNVDDGRTLLTTLLVAADRYADTVLHKAIRHSHEDLAAALLQWVHDNTDRSVMATLLLATDEDGDSVLHESARWNRVQLIETLLRWTCDYTDADSLQRHLAARNINGRTAVEEASIKGHEIAVEKLMSFDIRTGM